MALNHCWSSAFQITARGLTTRPLPHGDRTFTIEFDLIGHELVITTSDGMNRSLPLAPRSVAAFYLEVMATLEEMKLPVRIWPVPVEVPNPIRFTDDTIHASYDRAYVEDFWHILAHCERVFSPVPWGASDVLLQCSPESEGRQAGQRSRPGGHG